MVVDIHLDRQGPPFICNIRDTSPLKNQIKLGDRIIAVDDKDVHKWSAIKVSKLLAQKADNSERKMTVRRDM